MTDTAVNKDFKHRITTSTGKELWVVVKSSMSEEDIYSLIGLNKKWQANNVEGQDRGFLSGGEFGFDTFETLASRNEIVIGKHGDELVSYYNINTVIKEGVLADHYSKVEELKNSGIIPFSAKVAVGVQVLVETMFQGSDLVKHMIDQLVKNCLDRFDFFYTTISKDNNRSINAHKKGGWQFVDEDEKYHHLVYELSKHKSLNLKQATP